MPGALNGVSITTPHDHDVLSGRGNFVNYHPGNEHFRALVRKYKMDYVKCPKPQKGKYSKLIYDEIKARNPPGRFLKQDNKTKDWYDIGEKKALDKTRQALREGAPELMKEMSGDSGEDSGEEPVIARKKQPAKKDEAKSSAATTTKTTFSNNDSMQSFLQSPNMMKSGMMSIGSIGTIGLSPMTSPGMMSPGFGMLMTPDMQFSEQQMGSSMAGRLQSPLSEMIPPPQVHPVPNSVESMDNMMSPHQQRLFQQQKQQLQQLQMHQQFQQMTPQQQQQFLMNMSAMNNGGGNFDVLTLQQQQQLQQQMRINQMRQQMMNNQMQQQVPQQPQHMHMNQLRQQQQNHSKLQQRQQFAQSMQMQSQQPQTASEMRMLQNKLAAIYSTGDLDPRPIADQTLSFNHPQSNTSRAKDEKKDGNVLDNTIHTGNTGRGNTSISRVEIPPGNNPRRMPPPSLLKRDDSLKMDKIFEPTSPGGDDTKKKYGDGGNGSSAHLSAMSLSMGDLNDDGNLSQVFDSSLKISGNSKNPNVGLRGKSSTVSSSFSPVPRSSAKVPPNWVVSDGKIGERSSNDTPWDNANFDMSVATIGASEIVASDIGNMSYATLNMPDQEGHMSFTSHVFEEAEK